MADGGEAPWQASQGGRLPGKSNDSILEAMIWRAENIEVIVRGDLDLWIGRGQHILGPKVAGELRQQWQQATWQCGGD